MAQVVIKALRKRGGIIEWCYDSPDQARTLWKELTQTGLAPDTGCELDNACYFLGDKIEPHKSWNWNEDVQASINRVAAILNEEEANR
jgi:hypothetical protein